MSTGEGKMRTKRMVYLSDAAVAYIAEHLTDAARVLAEQLDRPYDTVVKARRRIAQGGWACPVIYVSCLQCGGPICTRTGRSGRRVHERCKAAHKAARAAPANRRYNQAHPGRSTPHAAAWRQRHPERVREQREAARLKARQRYKTMPVQAVQAMLDHVHEADQDDYAMTLERANNHRELWDEEEDRYLLEHPGLPAREIGLKLGRTLWSVRARRAVLRRFADAE